MKLLLTSDTHYSNRVYDIHRRSIKKMVLEKPDVILHAGDWTTCLGPFEMELTLRMFREEFGYEIPFFGVLGNHDYWDDEDSPNSEYALMSRIGKIKNLFRQYNVHLLDGQCKRIGDILFCGLTGWYSSVRPPTNDHKFLPTFIENKLVHAYFMDKAQKDFQNVLDMSRRSSAGKKVLLMHFPTMLNGPRDDGFVAPTSWHPFVIDHFDIAHFGHTHTRVENKIDGKCSINNSGANDRERNLQYIVIDI